jgi:hypothetical protein
MHGLQLLACGAGAEQWDRESCGVGLCLEVLGRVDAMLHQGNSVVPDS